MRTCKWHNKVKLGYQESHMDAEERRAKGEQQIQCKQCSYWFWHGQFGDPRILRDKNAVDLAAEKFINEKFPMPINRAFDRAAKITRKDLRDGFFAGERWATGQETDVRGEK